MISAPYGFRILGSPFEVRRLVVAADAFGAYASLDKRAEVNKEAYLSAFQFGDDFRQLLQETGSTRDFTGACWSPWVWFDVDREENLEQARRDMACLVSTLEQRYLCEPDEMLIFFSGSKGFHVGLPTALWSPGMAVGFHKTARKFAEHAAELAAVKIDSGVYDAVRAFRAPNSRHPKTGYFKRKLSLEELTSLTMERILELSRAPEPFELPRTSGTSSQAAADWQAAIANLTSELEAKNARREINSAPTLNRLTLDFIRNGADPGDRHRRLFSAAANLQEFGCSPALATALLMESGLDSGLPPQEVYRQIQCGLDFVPSSAPTAGPSASALAESSAPRAVADASVERKVDDVALLSTQEKLNRALQIARTKVGRHSPRAADPPAKSVSAAPTLNTPGGGP
jgi:hypothetical protein